MATKNAKSKKAAPKATKGKGGKAAPEKKVAGKGKGGKATKPAPKAAAKGKGGKATKPAPKAKASKAPKTQTVRAMIEVELPAISGLNALLTKAAFGKNFALVASSAAAKKLGVAKPLFQITAVKGAAPGSDEEE